jgi:hypothetical protein
VYVALARRKSAAKCSGGPGEQGTGRLDHHVNSFLLLTGRAHWAHTRVTCRPAESRNKTGPWFKRAHCDLPPLPVPTHPPPSSAELYLFCEEEPAGESERCWETGSAAALIQGGEGCERGAAARRREQQAAACCRHLDGALRRRPPAVAPFQQRKPPVGGVLAHHVNLRGGRIPGGLAIDIGRRRRDRIVVRQTP